MAMTNDLNHCNPFLRVQANQHVKLIRNKHKLLRNYSITGKHYRTKPMGRKQISECRGHRNMMEFYRFKVANLNAYAYIK